MTILSGWGRYPLIESDLLTPRCLDATRSLTAEAEGAVARGNGRAYGDAAIGIRQTISTARLDRVRAFDANTGKIVVEAGVLLADLIDTFLPRGFFPSVVPGTRFVTVGGAIAADVHGKNHHRGGGFGDKVDSFVLATASGEVVCASRKRNPEIFSATVGGMGLTGTILEATFLLKPIATRWICQRTIVAPDLASAIAAFEDNDDAEYSVAWIDCLAKGAHLGRSLVFLGRHAGLDDLRGTALEHVGTNICAPGFTLPVDFPELALNHWFVRAFNQLYFHRGKRNAGSERLVPLGPYFFPLDRVADWNRVYGRQGFIQHQCVIPAETAPAALAQMLDRITQYGDSSFLAILKKLGRASGLMSFALPGYTLALDFPVRPGLFVFLNDLDRIVVNAGGRIYLAKDACQSPATFEAGYRQLGRFREIRRDLDPAGRIRSHLAKRLGI